MSLTSFRLIPAILIIPMLRSMLCSMLSSMQHSITIKIQAIRRHLNFLRCRPPSTPEPYFFLVPGGRELGKWRDKPILERKMQKGKKAKGKRQKEKRKKRGRKHGSELKPSVSNPPMQQLFPYPTRQFTHARTHEQHLWNKWQSIANSKSYQHEP